MTAIPAAMAKTSSKIDAQDTLAFWVYRSARLLRRSFLGAAKAKRVQLTPEQWFCLNKLNREDGLSQVELCETTLSDRPNMTRILTSLETKGMVKRKADKEDQRRMRVNMTSKGQRSHDAFAAVFLEEDKQIRKGISKKDLADLRRMLDVIEKNLDHA